MNKAMSLVIDAQHITKIFRENHLVTPVLSDVHLQVAVNEFVAIMGASGSGKSTLLQVLGGLDDPSSGRVLVAGQEMSTLNVAQRARFRNQYLGFVYQFHHLLPEFSALENVAMPLLLRDKSDHKLSYQKAAQLLARVGLAHREQHKPGELSGGERQRVAIARALVNDPCVLLADEPTGNLDQKTAHDVMQLLLELKAAMQMSLVIVTHDASIAQHADRIVEIRDGSMVESTAMHTA